MSSGKKQFLQRWLLTRPLPYLKQGSTLSIRSQLQTNLRIRSHWRDDGHLSFSQQRRVLGDGADPDHNYRSPARILLSRNEDKMTSLGREDPHVSIHVLGNEGIDHPATDENSGAENKRATTMLSLPHPTTLAAELCEEEGNCLTLDVPDKINIDCDLSKGGSIFVESKIEGDVRLKTAQGNISVQKLRGHNIDLEIASSDEEGIDDGKGTSKPSFIFVSDVLESQSLRLVVPRPSLDRIRVKRIHANTMEIQVGGDKNNENTESTFSTHKIESLFDDDDAGAICDISSLYLIGDAFVDIKQSNGQQRQAVRIKSHHGHVHVQASAPTLDDINNRRGDALPFVDLGGVNGSCEVWVSRTKNDVTNNVSLPRRTNAEWTSCHVHFDSIAPDSVSLIHAEEGDIHVTVDRKVESDVRLLSSPCSANINTETLLLEDNEDGSMADEVSHMLKEIENSAALVSEEDPVSSGISTICDDFARNRIRIKTEAFTSRERVVNDQLKYCEYFDGYLANTTDEPDSRFDRKIKGNSGGGKINIDGAQNQALHGFGVENSNTDDGTEDTFARPLLAVFSSDKIILETLSWLGNIARRYGLDDNLEDDDLGRQATRRKGLGREIPKNQ